jgi:hypothetical protein
MNPLSVICKREPLLLSTPSKYDQPYRFVDSFNSRASLNQERTECGAQDGQGSPCLDFRTPGRLGTGAIKVSTHEVGCFRYR